MRIHLPSLPHTSTTRAYDWCAYTAKVRRFADMMTAEGHDVFLYGGPGNEAAVREHVIVADTDFQARHFGRYNWTRDVFDRWNADDPAWVEYNLACVEAIEEREQPGDILAIIGGQCQAQMVRCLPDLVPVEWGIGYEGIIGTTYHVFESTSWQHYVYGKAGITDGRYYDTVIPNAYDPAEYLLGERGGEYALYLGRPTERKGLNVLRDLAEHIPIVTAGQGDPGVTGGEHRGLVLGQAKRRLLAGARVVLVPTQYVEPFGGVAVEAMLSGVPVIASPWGAFTETVVEGLTGWLPTDLPGMLEAWDRAEWVDPWTIREYAKANFSTAHVAPIYTRYLERVQSAHTGGDDWYGAH